MSHCYTACDYLEAPPQDTKMKDDTTTACYRGGNGKCRKDGKHSGLAVLICENLGSSSTFWRQLPDEKWLFSPSSSSTPKIFNLKPNNAFTRKWFIKFCRYFYMSYPPFYFFNFFSVVYKFLYFITSLTSVFYFFTTITNRPSPPLYIKAHQLQLSVQLSPIHYYIM